MIIEGSIEIYVIVFEQQGTEVSTGAIYNSHPYEYPGRTREGFVNDPAMRLYIQPTGDFRAKGYFLRHARCY